MVKAANSYHSPFTIDYSLSFVVPAAHVREVSGDRRGGGHRWAHEVRAAALALAAFEVTVARRGAALAWRERVRVHAEAHRTACLTPLETGRAENLVEALGLRGA